MHIRMRYALRCARKCCVIAQVACDAQVMPMLYVYHGCYGRLLRVIACGVHTCVVSW